MPNYVANKLTIWIDKSEHEYFKRQYMDGNDFDFEKIIPSPKTIDECPDEYILPLKGEEVHIEIDEDKSWFDWYNWRVKNWGTKWNACNTNTSYDENCITIYFDTAWSPPYPVIEKLMGLLKDVDVDYLYAEEQVAYYCGHIQKCAESDEIESEDFPSYSKEAYETYFELWGELDEYTYDPDEDNYVEDEEGNLQNILNVRELINKIIPH